MLIWTQRFLKMWSEVQQSKCIHTHLILNNCLDIHSTFLEKIPRCFPCTTVKWHIRLESLYNLLTFHSRLNSPENISWPLSSIFLCLQCLFRLLYTVTSFLFACKTSSSFDYYRLRHSDLSEIFRFQL